jgi:hypothetical protein
MQWKNDRQTPAAEGIKSTPLFETKANISMEPITFEEFEWVVSNFKKNKAPGPSGVPIEAVKLLDRDAKNALITILNHCLRTKQVTLDMNQADLAVIFKKGITDQPANYRPIALLNISYKNMASIVQKRIAQGLDERLDKAQYGFRRKLSTLQPLFLFRRTQEIHEESGQEFRTLLLDWEKAFDRVDQERLVIVLRRMGIPDGMVTSSSTCTSLPPSRSEKGKRDPRKDRKRPVLDRDALSRRISS